MGTIFFSNTMKRSSPAFSKKKKASPTKKSHPKQLGSTLVDLNLAILTWQCCLWQES
jgi:hypothetical protein